MPAIEESSMFNSKLWFWSIAQPWKNYWSKTWYSRTKTALSEIGNPPYPIPMDYIGSSFSLWPLGGIHHFQTNPDGYGSISNSNDIWATRSAVWCVFAKPDIIIQRKYIKTYSRYSYMYIQDAFRKPSLLLGSGWYIRPFFRMISPILTIYVETSQWGCTINYSSICS
jgi:hypothetical protein